MSSLKRWNGTSWENVDTGVKVIGGQGGQILQSITVSTDVPCVDILNLNHLTDGDYTLEYSCPSATASKSLRMYMQDNYVFDITDSNYAYQYANGTGSNIIVNTLSAPNIGYCEANNLPFIGHVSIKVVNSFAYWMSNTLIQIDNTPTLVTQMHSGMKKAAVTKLTGLRLMMESGNIKAGSTFRLYGSNVASIPGYPACISKNRTITVGNTGCDYTTIQAAIDSLNNVWISPTAIVTIQIADGTYILTAPLTINHPCGSQINIVGTSTYNTNITSIYSQGSECYQVRDSNTHAIGFSMKPYQYSQLLCTVTTSGTPAGTNPANWPTTEDATSVDGSVTWTSGICYRSLVFTVSSVTNFAVGDYVLVKGAAGGTNPNHANGSGQISAIDSGNNRITVKMFYNFLFGGSYSPSGAVTATMTVIKTVIDCKTNSINGVILNGNLALWDKIVLRGRAQLSPSITGFNVGLNTVPINTTMMPSYITLGSTSLIVGFLYGVLCRGGSVNATNSNFAGNYGPAIQVRNNGFVDCSGAYFSGCSSAITTEEVTGGGSVSATSSIYCTGITSTTILCGQGSTMYLNAPKLYGCGNQYNYNFMSFGSLKAPNAFTEGSGYGWNANYGGYIYATGFTFTGAFYTEASPSYNTVGNNNSFICK